MGIPGEFAAEFARPSVSRLINTAIEAGWCYIFHEGAYVANIGSGQIIASIIGHDFKHTGLAGFRSDNNTATCYTWDSINHINVEIS